MENINQGAHQQRMDKQFRIEHIVPILNVKDISVSLDFYVNALGFIEAEWGKGTFFTSVSRDKSGIYLCQNGQGCSGTWIWIGFDGDIRALYSEFRSKGVLILEPPTPSTEDL